MMITRFDVRLEMMSKYLIYVIGFFIVTLMIQAIIHGISKGNNKKWMIFTGTSAICGICIIGVLQQNIALFAAIIGFVLADGIGEVLGWH